MGNLSRSIALSREVKSGCVLGFPTPFLPVPVGFVLDPEMNDQTTVNHRASTQEGSPSLLHTVPIHFCSAPWMEWNALQGCAEDRLSY